MSVTSPMVDILMLALYDPELRQRFQEDFEGTLAGLEQVKDLTQAEKEGLWQAFNHTDEAACSGCAYDMSCAQRGAWQ